MPHSFQEKKRKRNSLIGDLRGVGWGTRGAGGDLASMTEHSTSFRRPRIESQGAVPHQSTYDQ